MLARRDIPNALTILRLVLTAIFIAVLALFDGTTSTAALLPIAASLFIVAAITDALDGYLARRWRVESLFGRVMDPVADKVLVMGAFVMLCGPAFIVEVSFVVDSGEVIAGRPVFEVAPQLVFLGVAPWMVVVILSRELLVTSLRSVLETQGVDFRARASGKWKMILQSVCVPVVLLWVWMVVTTDAPELLEPWPTAIGLANDALIWLTVTVTAISGVPYVTAAIRATHKPTAPPTQ